MVGRGGRTCAERLGGGLLAVLLVHGGDVAPAPLRLVQHPSTLEQRICRRRPRCGLQGSLEVWSVSRLATSYKPLHAAERSILHGEHRCSSPPPT